MSALLFRLNDVPADEAAEVRELLTAHGFDFYETEAGRWGISVAALWLRDEERLQEAHRLIDDYQAARQARVQAEYEALKREGRHETLTARFLRDPLRFLFYVAAIAAILYLSLLPFLRKW
jgi:hypothetical protein